MSRHKTSALLCALFALTGCKASERMQTVIKVEAQQGMRDAVSDVTVRVLDAANEQIYEQRLERPAWPVQLVFAPKNDDPSRSFKLEVAAHGAEARSLVEFDLRAGYARGESRYASIMILDTCLAQSSPSCTTAACEQNQLSFDPNDALGRSADKPAKFELGCKGGGVDTGDTDTSLTGEAGSGPEQAGEPGSSARAGAGGDTAGTPSVMSSGSAGAAGLDAAVVDATIPCTPDSSDPACGSTTNACALKPCGDKGSCVDLAPGYMCNCQKGFESTGSTCVNVDECALPDRFGCAEQCTDSFGSATCGCEGNHWLKSDEKSCAQLREPQVLSSESSTIRCQPDLAFDESGNGLAVWIQSDGTMQSLWSARYAAGNGWEPARKLDHAAFRMNAPILALAPSGSGLVMWLENSTDGARQTLWFAPYREGAVGLPQVLGLGAGDVGYASVAIDKNGDGVAMWSLFTGTALQSEIWVNRYVATRGAFLGARAIAGSATSSSVIGRLSLDDTGRGLAIWLDLPVVDGGVGALEAVPRTAVFEPRIGGGTWRLSETPLDVPTSLAPDVSLQPDGRGLVVWERYSGSEGFMVFAKDYDPKAGFAEQPRILSTVGTGATLSAMDFISFLLGPVVASGPNGATVVAWPQRQNGARSIILASRGTESGSWMQGAPINEQDSLLPTWMGAVLEQPFDLALDARDGGVVVWSDYTTDNKRTISARRLHPGANFDARLPVLSDATPLEASGPRVALDPRGDGAIVWDAQIAGGRYEVQASRLD